LEDILVTIVKDNKLININADALCPGDMLILQAGELVPADLLLVESRSLEVDEFDITGEIMPVYKNATEHKQVYAGSKVLKGSGKGIVAATGADTEYGNILNQAQNQGKSVLIDRLRIHYFVPAVLLLPGVLFLSFQLRQPFLIMGIYFFYRFCWLLFNINHFFDFCLSRENSKYAKTARSKFVIPVYLKP